MKSVSGMSGHVIISTSTEKHVSQREAVEHVLISASRSAPWKPDKSNSLSGLILTSATAQEEYDDEDMDDDDDDDDDEEEKVLKMIGNMACTSKGILWKERYLVSNV